MKSIYALALSFLLFLSAGATTWTVTVSNFSFNPATLNVVVGDIIQFNWQNGAHTTTCGAGLPGTSLPTGAPEWNSAMSSTTTTFSYTVTVAGDYLYGCVPHFGGGMEGRITASGALPLRFGSFNVINADTKALLQWKTVSEANTSYFSIRKSKDATHFYEIGRIDAAGNSDVEKSYQFADADLGKLNKYLYYEIVTVDKDKKETFSAIKTFRNNSIIKDNLIMTLSPNPITKPGQLQIQFNADKSGQMDVSVYNSAGQMVLKTKMAAFYGLNNGHLHVCDLEKGTYNVIFNLEGKKEVKKIMIL